MKTIFKRDFDTYSGKLLEKYFIEKLAQSNAYSLIGRYWTRGNRNEIDIVALNQLSKEALIAEVKINKKKINLEQLKEKAKFLSAELQGFKIHFKGFSLENM
jgi:AAA+ ATPase superfamily predicted ATPase